MYVYPCPKAQATNHKLQGTSTDNIKHPHDWHPRIPLSCPGSILKEWTKQGEDELELELTQSGSGVGVGRT
jgi:hypothetical protein